jgi:hypothetical protein
MTMRRKSPLCRHRWKEYLVLTGHCRLLKIAEELKDKFQSFFNTYNAIKRKGLSIEEIGELLKRGGEINVELTSKENLSINLNKQIKEKKDIISKLNIEINTLSIVKMVLTQVVNSLTREKERLGLFLQSYNTGYNYQRTDVIRLPYKSVQ